jgi:hypothetical protein
MKTMEHVEAGFRFRWAGGTFIPVQHVDSVLASVPYDMMQIPEWVNVSQLDDEGFQTLCRLWLHRSLQHA